RRDARRYRRRGGVPRERACALCHRTGNRRGWGLRADLDEPRAAPGVRVRRCAVKRFTMRTSMRFRSVAIVLGRLLFASPAAAAQCGGDLTTFLSAMAREAAAAGVSRSVIDSAFAGVTLDGAVLSFDRRQRGTFRKSFEEYAAPRVTAPRLKRARALMQ